MRSTVRYFLSIKLIGTPTPTPTPSYGSLSFTSIPPGADIYLDNAYKGFTPLTVNGVSNGNHVVVMRLDSYQDASRTVPVTGNSQTIGITLVPLTTATPTTQPTVTGTVQPVPSGRIRVDFHHDLAPGCTRVCRRRDERFHANDDPGNQCGNACRPPDEPRLP